MKQFKNLFRAILITAVWPWLLSSPVLASPSNLDLANFLERFQKNSAKAMEERPPKWDSQGRQIKNPESHFTAQQIRSKSYIELKDQLRKETCTEVNGSKICLKNLFSGKAGYLQNDLAENLIDNPETAIRTLQEMDEKKFLSAKLENMPWPDFYWPIYLGSVGVRYTEPSFPFSTDWKVNFDFITQNPFLTVLQSGDQKRIDNLAPGEKYSALIGDDKNLFTQYFWSEGQDLYQEFKKVETWMGLCHGWAPASYMLNRPMRPIEALAADGKTKLTFYPSDIKALSTVLWANTPPPVKFIGGRCNSKDPKRDPNGRVIERACFDTNPGTWHLAIVNQLAVSRRSFVIDATWDYEVWNQPVYSYTYSYFNPQTATPVNDLKSATVALKDFNNDKFASYRSKEAVNVVGISMDLTYVIETRPSHENLEGEAGVVPLRTVRYVYDVELDANNKIVGGEWYSVGHPDFLWSPKAGSRALSLADPYVPTTDSWNRGQAVPASWQKLSQVTSKYAQPLARIVETLIDWSRENPR